MPKTRTIRERCGHGVKFTICTFGFHNEHAAPCEKSVPLQRQKKMTQKLKNL